jgi:hypothetical protein
MTLLIGNAWVLQCEINWAKPFEKCSFAFIALIQRAGRAHPQRWPAGRAMSVRAWSRIEKRTPRERNDTIRP